MNTLLQKADKIMREQLGCKISFYDGNTIKCEKITGTAFNITGNSAGNITILNDERKYK